jgi:hyperosmotically inducible protein
LGAFRNAPVKPVRKWKRRLLQNAPPVALALTSKSLASIIMKFEFKFPALILATVPCLVGLVGCQEKNNSGNQDYATATNAAMNATEKASNAVVNAYVRTKNAITNMVTNTNSMTTNIDNSGINVRDRNGATLLPGDQGNSAADIATTQMIRKTLVSGANEFSVISQNVKIITGDGKVTLRGPVNTESEKNGIGAIAKTIAGEGNVDNQIEVKPTQ